MKFYYFGGVIGDTQNNQIKELEDHHFSGVLFTYNPYQGDFFTLIARDINVRKKIKYMVAIRPHTISPQYLCMINQSMNTIMEGRLQINLIAGHIKRKEEDYGGFIDEISDQSSVIDRTNYLIQYVGELDRMSSNDRISVPDFYVSCTNKYLYDSATQNGSKIILPYKNYKEGHFYDDNKGSSKIDESFTISNQKIMLAVNPVLRDTQEQIDTEFPLAIEGYSPDQTKFLDRHRGTTDTEFFTYQEFYDFIKKLEKENITEVMMNSWPIKEKDRILEFVKKYVESEEPS